MDLTKLESRFECRYRKPIEILMDQENTGVAILILPFRSWSGIYGTKVGITDRTKLGATRFFKEMLALIRESTCEHREAFAFNQCAERNLCGMVEAEIRILEADLFAGKAFLP